MSTRPVTIALLDSERNVIASAPIVVRDSSNPFRSGACGYNSTGKLAVRSVRGESDQFHQLSFSLTEINSQDEALAKFAAEKRSAKEQLQAKMKELRDQMKHLA